MDKFLKKVDLQDTESREDKLRKFAEENKHLSIFQDPEVVEEAIKMTLEEEDEQSS